MSGTEKGDDVGIEFIEIAPDSAEDLAQQEAAATPWPWSVSQIVRSLSGDHSVIAIRSGAQTLGYCVFLDLGEEVEILNLVIFSDFQRQGFGRLMLEKIKSLAREQGAFKLWLEMRAGNHRAREVYRSAGFVQTGRRERYYPTHAGSREDAVLMECELSNPS
ncbi:MAG: GNAT family N-acetyltransferase [bacterium]